MTLGTNFKLALKSAHILYVYTNDLFQFKAYSDEYWECAVRQFTYPMYHEAGTCPMGPDSDPKLSTCPSWCTMSLVPVPLDLTQTQREVLLLPDVPWVWYLSHGTIFRPKGKYLSYLMYHNAMQRESGENMIKLSKTGLDTCGSNLTDIWHEGLQFDRYLTRGVVIWKIFDTKGCNLTDIWHVGL